jgi:predicted P-loop ATPase
MFPKWLVLVYKQATLQDENRICLIFAGAQNKGKTSTFRKLCAPIMNGSRSYFFEGSLNPDRTDSIFTLSDNFLISLDELETTTKNSMAALKSLISRQVTTARRPYAIRAETIKRRASFGGSVNDATDLLRDHTGNTRWLIFNSGDIDFKMRDEIDYDRLWAEVKSLKKYEEHFLITSGDIEIQEMNNLKYLQTGTEYDLIYKYFEILEKEDVMEGFEGTTWHFLNATEIADKLQEKTKIKINPYNISRSISKLGGKSYVRWIEKKTIRGFYVKEKNV